MTTIRKIVTSKVDGNSADSNDTNEIRPFGEIAVYLNTEPNPDKLTLMMFDGTRTHLKSMVLAPGRLYGSDADSGDGNSRDTIKLIPDASLSDYTGNDQYLIIDPTGGIRIRAGGTIDNSNADLYLGGEKTFVRVSDTTDDVVIRTGLNAGIENIEVNAVDEWGPPGGPGGVWRLFIGDEAYPTLGTTVQIGETVTTSWGTPITATITDIQQDAGNWQIHVDQDITAGHNDYDTVTFNRGRKTWTFDSTGKTVLPSTAIFNGTDGIVLNNLNAGIAGLFNDGDVYITGGNSVRFTGIDTIDGISESVLRFWNAEGRHSSGNDPTELVTLDVGNDATNGDPTEGFLKIITEKETGSNKEWKFDANGVLHLPTSGDIVDSEGNSVLGLVDNNIWVQTFETASPATDVPQVAVSVEYDSAGNIIALFSHVNPDNGSTYYSVGKYTTTGTRIWTARFDDEFYTDGWGLAVDNAGGFIYIAGQTVADGGQNNATLTKISGATGLVEWSKIYDFGYNSTSAVVDVNAEGDPVMVGYASNGDDRYVTTTKIDQTDGSVIWSRGLDGQGDDQAYGMAVGPTGEVVAIGYIDQLDESTTYSVTPLTGSGVNVLVINRSDLNGAVLSDAAEIAGTGITGTIGVNAINVYTGLTGTVQEGTGAVFEIGDNGLGAYTASGIQNNGTNYLPGHKILVLGTNLGGATPANDCVITVDSISEGGLIFNWSVTGTAAGVVSAVYGPVTGTNYQTGSGITFDLFMNSDSTYSAQPVEITAVGSNYVDNDVIVISGALLGGTSPANDLTATIDVTGNNGSGISNFLNFSGNAQTTTYRVRTDDNGIDFGGVGTWTLSNVETDTDDRMLVVKYAADGTIAWQKAIQFDEGYACSGSDADIDSEGNIYVCGQYYTDIPGPINQLMSIVKFNSSGVKQWSRRIVGNCGAFTSSIVVGADDHLYLTATTFAGTENTVTDIHLVLAKYGFDGLVEWQRLLDFTAGYSFGSSFFGSDVGGSNLAVKQDYVAVGLGFGLEESFGPDFGSINAAVAQIPASGNVFTVGSWDFKSASFSGTVNSTASDIVVTNANKTDYDNIAGIDTVTVTLEEDSSNFLVGTLYTAPSGNASLVNGAYSVTLSNTGTVTLPAGGTITEGYVTSNPTIQLTPASPDVASQKLVIKGGGAYTYTDNGISINYNNNTAIVGDTLTFYINSNTYADQTLYWWIYPEGANISDPGSGTVAINEFGYGSFSFDLDSDDNEFTVRVSPEDNNYDPANVGVETGLINADAPTFDSEHHLHLTTGNLAETSIFLGTDDQNVRTTVNGGIEITTPNIDTTNVWQFGTDGSLQIPGNIRSEGNINIDINLSDSTLRRWQFGEDGVITLPNGMTIDASVGFGIVEIGGDDTRITIDNGGAPPGFSVTTNALMSGPTGTAHTWRFGPDGELTFPNDKIKAPVSSNISIETEVPISDPPTTIVISGADFTAVNLTYIKDGANSIWYPAGYNPATDPYIEFINNRWEILNPGFDQAIYVNTGSLNEPLAQWDTNPPLGSVAPTGVYTYPNTYTHAWQFGTDGSLTFPDATVQTTALVQGEQIFTLDTGNIDYAPTAVDFNLLFVTSAIGYSETDPTSVTLPNGVPGQRLVIFNGYNLATLTVNPGPFGRDISSGVVAEFIYSGFDGLWIPLYGTNSPT